MVNNLAANRGFIFHSILTAETQRRRVECFSLRLCVSAVNPAVTRHRMAQGFFRRAGKPGSTAGRMPAATRTDAGVTLFSTSEFEVNNCLNIRSDNISFWNYCFNPWQNHARDSMDKNRDQINKALAG